MPIVLAIAAVAALFWALAYARRASLTLAALATLAVGYVLGHSFWNAHVGPLPLTLDRLLLAGVGVTAAWRWRRGQWTPCRVGGAEWALAAVLVWLTLSALASRPGDGVRLPTSPIWRLLFSFWAPAMLFFLARAAQESTRNCYLFLAGLSALGGYLALTAMAETAGLWALVFPRYIADPDLGLHFGRARGPALNSVSLGIHLTVCLWALWLLLPKAPTWAKVALAAMLPAMVVAIYLTYTRSVWLGLIASGVAMLAMQTPRHYRSAVLTVTLGAAVLMGPLLAAKVLFLEREDSGNVSRHSVQQRTAFAYVSWNMFCDNPLLGVGFGRFYDQKLPYLSDRSQSFELESIRDLHHHNTLLSLLTETGLVGMLAYVGLLFGLLRACGRLSQASAASDAERRLGMLAVATIMAYLPSAVFHDLSLVHNDQWLLMLVAGAAVSRERRLGLKVEERAENPALDRIDAVSHEAQAVQT